MYTHCVILCKTQKTHLTLHFTHLDFHLSVVGAFGNDLRHGSELTSSLLAS